MGGGRGGYVPLLYRTGMWSVARRALALMPTSNGLPRRVATHSPGKWTLLKHSEKAPSYRHNAAVKTPSNDVEFHSNVSTSVSAASPHRLLSSLFYNVTT